MPAASAHEQIELLRQVLELARSQREALERDDLDAFEALLARRETLLRAGGVVGAAGAIALVNDVSLANDEAAAIDTIVQRILEQDRTSEAQLGELMTSVRDEMPGLAKGHQANAAYRLSERPSTFINRVS